MKRQFSFTAVIAIAVVAFGLGAGIGVGAWIWISGGSGVPSEAAAEKAPQLSLGNDTSAETPVATTEKSSVAPTLSLGGNEATAESTPEGTSAISKVFAKRLPVSYYQTTPTPTPTPTEIPAEPITISRGLYRINSELSNVTFTLQEDLRGQRIDVVGATNEVGGDLIVDYTDPSASQVGAIVVNARALETDNSFRNQALRGQILRSADDAYEFITFTPTSIEGLPSDAVTESGGTYSVTISGDLTIIETTVPVTFEGTITLNNQNQLSGTATTTILYSDFNITIPNAPGVANITPEVVLAINFVADLVDSEGGDSASAIDYQRALFRLNTESNVTFTLQEDLRGQRIDVVGTTNEVGGDIIIDVTTPANSQLGGIVINARALETDNSFRNQALRGQILRSADDAYEFINFTPTSLSGLDSATVAVGEAITFQVTGDLTIIETTLPVTFDVTATLESADKLVGTATAVVLWKDFNITIPNAPGVANITDEVTLTLNFVADLVEKE